MALNGPLSLKGRVIAHRPAEFDKRILALSIDDGPDPVITPRILAALKAHHAKATFFVLGANAHAHPEMLKHMIADGHEIGSHTYTHALHPSREQADRELDRTGLEIKKHVGSVPTLFRPPGGNMKSWTAKLALQQGYTVVLWTLSSADTATHSPEVIANNIIHTPSPGDNILMHDSASKAATAEALPRVLDTLSKQGWTFVTVSEMVKAWDEFEERQKGRKGRN